MLVSARASAPLVSRQAHAPKPRLRIKHGLARIYKCLNLGCFQYKKREFYNSLKLCIRLDAVTAFVKVGNGFIEIVRVVSVIPKVISVFFLRQVAGSYVMATATTILTYKQDNVCVLCAVKATRVSVISLLRIVVPTVIIKLLFTVIYRRFRQSRLRRVKDY